MLTVTKYINTAAGKRLCGAYTVTTHSVRSSLEIKKSCLKIQDNLEILKIRLPLPKESGSCSLLCSAEAKG